MQLLLILIVGLVTICVILQLVLLFRKPKAQDISSPQLLQEIAKASERTDRVLREEFSKNREEFGLGLRQTREEISNALKGGADSLNQQMANLTTTNERKIEGLRETLEQRLGLIQKEGEGKLDQIRSESNAAAQKAREEVTSALKTFNETTIETLKDMGSNQRSQLAGLVDQLTKLTEATEKRLEAQRSAVDEKLKQIQSDNTLSAKQLREEVGAALKGFNDSVLKGMTGMSEAQQNLLTRFSDQLSKLIQTNQEKFDAVKASLETQLKAIQADNTKQLDLIRATVDEKLQGTLEKRLGESFKLVSDRLEQVYKGLGEMQTLAIGVGDLKRVLTNVKTRGTWGEVQLGAMLEQVLSKEQYAANVQLKEGNERVEFAVKLPGRGQDKDEIVWLPIDAKFPIEDYQRLLEAQEHADVESTESAGRQLEMRVKQCAKAISDKYISPPKTTDFGILFLPTEGLFAEVIRRTGLVEFVQRECRVVIAGPTTLWSILNSLQMGFRTLAIEQRSSEVWKVLGAVKTEFGKFGDLLDGVKKKLDQASHTIEDASRKSRTIQRKLRTVQELPIADAQALISSDALIVDGESDAEQTSPNSE